MNLPKLRLNMHLEDMKMSVVNAVSEMEIEDYIKENAEEAVEEFDFESEVKEAVNKVLEEEVEAYFKYGPGMKAIREAIVEGFENLGDEDNA